MNRFLPEITGERAGGEGSVVLTLMVSPELDYFPDHFPQWAVLPGVVQVDWAVKFARRVFKLRGGFTALENLKFHKPVRPGTELELELVYEKDRARLLFSYQSAGGKHSSGRILFGGCA